jgi:hypothetical protein
MKHLRNYFLSPIFSTLILLAFFIPNHSFAQTTATSAELSAELNQIQTQLDTASSTASFTLSPGQSINQAASTTSNGVLSITLPSLLHSQPTLAVPTITQYAKLNLKYSPCVTSGGTAGINVCTAGPTAFPVMTSELALGQSTNYLTYNIALTQLSSTSATLEVTDSSFLTSIQNQINAVAAKIHAFLGK